MKNKPVDIKKCIYATYEGTWSVSIYRKGKIVFESAGFSSWMRAADSAINYCLLNSEDFLNIPANWADYFDNYQKHIDYMMPRKGQMSESAWRMDFSCSAPNEPNYTRANND